MNKLTKAIYEHLKTRTKYNTLENKHKIKCEDYDNKCLEMDSLKSIQREERKVWEEHLRKQTEEIIKLKEQITTLKKGVKKNVSKSKSKSA